MAGIRRRAYRSAPSGPPSPPPQQNADTAPAILGEPARCTPARADDAKLRGFRGRRGRRATPTPRAASPRAGLAPLPRQHSPFPRRNPSNDSSGPGERQRHVHIYKLGIARLAATAGPRVMADAYARRHWSGGHVTPFAARAPDPPTRRRNVRRP